jgi:hypothetical protein
VQFEVPVGGGHHHRARHTRRPDDLIVDQPLDMLEDGIAVITGFGQRRTGIGSQSESLAPFHVVDPLPFQFEGYAQSNRTNKLTQITDRRPSFTRLESEGELHPARPGCPASSRVPRTR